MSSDPGLLESISRLALFSDLDHERVAALLPRVAEVSFNEGDWIVRRGDTDVGLFIIVEGDVSVVIDEQELATLPTGSFFGEISALLHEPTVADIVARSHLRCLFVPAAEVEDFLLSEPITMLRMLQIEARRVRTTDELRI